jgi:hypothetical protein
MLRESSVYCINIVSYILRYTADKINLFYSILLFLYSLYVYTVLTQRIEKFKKLSLLKEAYIKPLGGQNHYVNCCY